MQKALEAALVVVVLAVGALLFRQYRQQSQPVPMSTGPGEDGASGPSDRPLHGVRELPPIKVSQPAKPMRRRSAVPSPQPVAP